MKKIVSIFLILVMVFQNTMPAMAYDFSTGSTPLFSYMVQSEGGQPSSNLQNVYSNNIWATPIASYMTDNGTSGYSRIEAIGETVYVEEYSTDFKYVSSKELEMELPIFGGCYVGENYAFLVFGQNNLEESDEVEVVRVVKYDKEWNRLASKSIYGANTQYPFEAGSLRMTEEAGLLYIHTCHQMYKTPDDGLNHQANMTFVIDEETMELTQSYYDIMNISVGYVSHSFNQFVVSDGTYLYRLDHCDGSPRAVVATKSYLSNITNCTWKNVVDISAGNPGNNKTGVSIGGFQIAGNTLVSTGNCVEYDGTEASMNGVRNIYATFTDTSFSSDTKTVWLTNYDENSTMKVGEPKLVKASEDTFYIIWEEADSSEEVVFFKIAKVSVTGEILDITEPIYGRMSDCEPMYTSDGRLVWYATCEDAPVFYSIDTNKLDEYKFSKIDFTKCEVSFEKDQCEYLEYSGNIIPEQVIYGNHVLEKDVHYTITYSEKNLVGKITATLEGKGYFSGKIEKSYCINPEAPWGLVAYANKNTEMELGWASARYATGYEIEQKIDGEWTLIQTVTNTSATITGLEPFTKYDFRIRAYTNADETVYYSTYKEVSGTTLLEDVILEMQEETTNSVTLSWNKVKGAARYELSWYDTTDTLITKETTELNCTVTGLDEGESYIFFIKAYGEDETFYTPKQGSIYIDIPYALSEDKVKINWYGEEYAYLSGVPIEPSVWVYYGEEYLLKDNDYVVSYHNNIDIGVGKLIIKGMKEYQGTIEKTFKIVPDKVRSLDGTSTATSINLSWPEIGGATGYDVYMSTDDTWNKIGTTSAPEYLVEGLEANMQYEFKVCAFAEKDGVIYTGEISEITTVYTKRNTVGYSTPVPTATLVPEKTATPTPLQSTITPTSIEQNITPVLTKQPSTVTPTEDNVTVTPVLMWDASTGSMPLFPYTVQSESGQASTNLENFHTGYYMEGNQIYLYNNMWAKPIKSYLMDKGIEGYSRIEAIGEKVYVEEYSTDFTYLSAKELEMELPIFGGCYIGEKYIFLVFGQSNFEERDDVEVVSVVKYDKEWNRLASKSIYGANTSYPFEAGSLRMTEEAGLLYIHTCHLMYATSDGYNHQANMTFVIEEETMEITQEYYKIMNLSEGYVSHSFNQFVVSDGTYLYRLDHGDAYPRAVVVTKCNLSNIDSCVCKAIVPIRAGESGDNATGVSVGGFQISGDVLVSVGDGVEYDGTEDCLSGVRNIYATFTNTSFDSSSGTQKIWLTSYDENSNIKVGTPKLVKGADDTLYVMWEEADKLKQCLFFRIAKISASGEVLDITEPIYGRMSDCEPLYTEDGRLVWYTAYKNTPVFYNIDTNNLESYHFSTIDCTKCEVTLEQKECFYSEIGSNEMPVQVKYGNCVLNEGSDYTLTYSNTNTVGKVMVTLEGKGYFSGKIENSYIIKPGITSNFYIYSSTNSQIVPKWDKVKHVTGYQLEQKIDGEWKLIQTLSSTDIQAEVTGLEPYTQYEFRVRAYTEADDTVYYGPHKEVSHTTMLGEIFFKEPKVTADSVTLSWNKVKGAVRYEIYWHNHFEENNIPMTLETTELNYTITGLSECSRHSFYIKAFGEGDKLCTSNVEGVSVTIKYAINEDNAEICGLEDTYICTSTEPIEPFIRVKYGDSTLKKDKEYIISYSDNTTVGTGTVTITGVNTYIGTLQKTFEILPDTVRKIKGDTTDTTIKLSWPSVNGATGYEVYTYEGENWTKLGTTSKAEYLIEGLEAGMEYNYKIRAFGEKDGKVYMGNFSEKKDIYTKRSADNPIYNETTSSVPKDEATPTPNPTGNVVTPTLPVQSITPPKENITPTVPTIIPTVTESIIPTPGNNISITPTLTEELSPKAVKLSKTSYTYNGKAKKPSVTVKNAKGEKLKLDKDYTITYTKGRKNVGIYTVTIKGKNGYTGIVKKTFQICPKATSLTKATLKDGKLNVKWKKAKGTFTGYEIQYSTNSNFKKSKKLLVSSKKTTTKQISKIKDNKKYYVRIRTYKTVKINGKNVKLYSKWSNKKTAK